MSSLFVKLLRVLQQQASHSKPRAATTVARRLKATNVYPNSFVNSIAASPVQDTTVVDSGSRAELKITPEVVSAGKSLAEVVRGWVVFKLFDFNFIVDNSIKLYRLSKALLGQQVTNKLLRLTVFGQFAGGINEDDTKTTVRHLSNVGISSIWFYSFEKDLDEVASPKNIEELSQQEEELQRVHERNLNCIKLSGLCNNEGVARFAAVKLTGIVDPNLLKKLNDMVLASERSFLSLSKSVSAGGYITDRRIPSHELKEKLPSSLNITEDSTSGVDIVNWNEMYRLPENVLNFQHLSKLSEEGGVESLSDLEQEQLDRFTRRLTDIGECAVASNVRVLIDAEQTYFQRAIDNVVLHYLQPRFNQRHPYIYNTVQTYLTRSYNNTLTHLATAKRLGFKNAIKLVRGCYLDLENRLSRNHGYISPVHPTKDDTDTSYHKSLNHILDSISVGDNSHIVVASHNQDTVFHAVRRIRELNLSPSSGQVVFGQLLGMADHLTYPLVQAGFSANKVVSFGSVDEVVPFLSRRAQENRGMMENARTERALYLREIKRRVFG